MFPDQRHGLNWRPPEKWGLKGRLGRASASIIDEVDGPQFWSYLWSNTINFVIRPSMQKLNSTRTLSLCLIPILFAGCGGGGSGEDSANLPPDQNNDEITSIEVPKIEKVKHSKSTGVTIKWNQVDNARYYTVERRGGLEEKKSEKVLADSYTDKIPPQFRSELTYRVKACNSKRCSDFSSEHKVEGQIGESVVTIKSNFPLKDARFGSSIALSDDNKWLAISAPLESTDKNLNSTNVIGGPGDDSGTVYIYKKINDGWALRQRLKSAKYASAARFGYDVEFSGDSENLIVGQPQRDVAWSDSNRSYALIYELSNGNFVYDDSIKIPDSYSEKSKDQYADFGKSVTINKDGSFVAVGAPADTTPETGVNPSVSEVALPQPEVGAVFIFRKTEKETDYMFSDLLKPVYLQQSDPGNLQFGNSLGMNDGGDQIFVGVPGDPSLDGGINADPTDKYTDADDPVDLVGASFRRGAVQEFVRNDQTWSYGAYLKPDKRFENLEFGSDLSVSNSGNIVAVSSVSSYLYRKTDGAWEKLERLDDGRKLAISPNGNFLVAGGRSTKSGDNENHCGTTNVTHGKIKLKIADKSVLKGIFEIDPSKEIPDFNEGCDSLFNEDIEVSKEGRIYVGAPLEDSFEGGFDTSLTTPDLQDSGSVFLF